jgi:dihydrolipoamide dehydrogenase
MSDQRFDLAVIGAGPGGYVAAIKAAQRGAKVAVIEKDRPGGTCLIWGCIPSKTLIRSVEVLEEARNAAKFGIELDESSIKPNIERMMARKDEVVNQNVKGIEGLFKTHGITHIKGHGSLVTPHRIAIRNGKPELEYIEAANTVIATGSQIARPPIPGANLDGITDSDRILSLKKIPKSIVIVGGGIIGVEWAGILSPLGVKVTIIEALPDILALVDEEIRNRFKILLKKSGINVQVGAKVLGIEENKQTSDEGEKLTVRYALEKGGQSEEKAIHAEMVMLATGRVPYTENLGLEEIGVLKKGRAIASNRRMQTNIENVYAIGDVTQRIMLAHVASHEGEVAADNITGHARMLDYRAVPTCIYSHPEIASVGPTEQELKEKGIPYRASKFPFTALGRAATLGDTNGLVKLLVTPDKGEILAGHIMGPNATDLVAELVLAVREQVTAEDLAHTIHAHPTLTEAVQEAALAAMPGLSSIHFYSKPRG